MPMHPNRRFGYSKAAAALFNLIRVRVKLTQCFNFTLTRINQEATNPVAFLFSGN